MNLFVRICRFLSDILTRSSPPAPVYDDLWSLENHQLLDYLFGSVVSKVEDVLLLRFPFTLYRLKNGEKLEVVSLSIPGKEKMIETDETLTIIVDGFETKDYKSGSYRSDWDWELNAVFISAVFKPRHSPEYPSPPIIKSIHSRINLGNHDLYKTMYQSEVKDGVLMLTFRKNPQKVSTNLLLNFAPKANAWVVFVFFPFMTYMVLASHVLNPVGYTTPMTNIVQRDGTRSRVPHQKLLGAPET
ncbi:hypothetical protein CTI12_AA092670 [Artemisia annua]|uniref:Uncharacterized protein n=1 Tax=Artemisia annua TaxID=35608 RepID=A0A2U1PZI8_ARTAN|nr:hypothetical protein CTI12_AA092670 [Artemisia annua]